jgi:YHS domain-containing protein
MYIKKIAFPLVVAAVFCTALAMPLQAETKSEIFKNWRGIAIKGYDPVAYYKEGKPVEGSSKFELNWKGAKWRFASAENRDLFISEPEKYAPQYGGYCAWAVSEGYTAGVDPKNAWRIVGGKLYLNYNVDIQKKWAKDIPGNIKKADANWPGVLSSDLVE